LPAIRLKIPNSKWTNIPNYGTCLRFYKNFTKKDNSKLFILKAVQKNDLNKILTKTKNKIGFQ
jgi:hypothetical protein